MLFAKVLLISLAASLAPIVTLVYRKGWFNTPDNPDSPHGMYEQKMQRIHAKWGTWLADWWWLGVRNQAYGLSYALKPAYFKSLPSYENCTVLVHWRGPVRVIQVDGFKEYVLQVGKFFHVIYGYRLRPIFDEVLNNRAGANIPFRPINMDARPILSIRAGKDD